jgi:hypothetical protein
LKPKPASRRKGMAHSKLIEEDEGLMNSLDVTEVKVHRHHVPPFMDQYCQCSERHKKFPNAHPHILAD